MGLSVGMARAFKAVYVDIREDARSGDGQQTIDPPVNTVLKLQSVFGATAPEFSTGAFLC
jgi:hypothetical protein